MIKHQLVRRKMPGYTLLIIAGLSLVLSLLLKNIFWEKHEEPAFFASEIEDRINQKLEVLDGTLGQVKQNIINDRGVLFSSLNMPSEIPYFVYTNGHLAYWSNVRYIPQYHEVRGYRPVEFRNLEAGQFVVSRQKFMLEGVEVEMIGLLPVFWNSRINNRYVKYGFNRDIFSSSKVRVKSQATEGDYPVSAFDTYYLFSLDFGTTYQMKEPYVKYLILILLFVSFMSLLIYGFQWVSYFLNRQKIVLAFSFMAVYLAVFRGFLLLSNFPYGVIRLELFDPRFYASSAFSPSLGDLLLNELYLLCLVGFAYHYYYRSRLHGYVLKFSGKTRVIFSIALIVVSHLVLSLQFDALSSILYNSQWTIDITREVDIDIFKVVSLFIVFINALIFFLFSDIYIKIFLRLNEYNRSTLIIYYVAGALIFGLYGWIVDLPVLVILIVNMLYFVLVSVLRLPKNIKAFNFISFSYFFLSAFASAFIGAYAIFSFDQNRLIDDKERFASQLLQESDGLGEYLLGEASEKVKNDVFIQNRMFSPFSSKDIIKEKIKRVFLGNYFSKYDVQIYLFNSRGEAFEEYKNFTTFQRLYTALQKEEYRTSYDYIYFVNQVGNTLDKRYYSLIPIERYGYGINSGYIVIELKLKRTIPDNVYPELLVDRRFLQPFLEKNYDYAIFSKGKLVYNAGNFNYIKEYYAPKEQTPRLFTKGVIREGYHHLGIRGENQQLIVISSQLDPQHVILSNFSFLFLVMVFFVTLLLLVYVGWFNVQKVNMTLTTKIQLYLNMAIFLPLLVVSVTILSRVHTFHKRDLNIQYFEKAEKIRKNITSELNSYLLNETPKEVFTSKLLELAGVMETDVNVFNIRGRLITSSQPMIYENKLLSEYINPEALALIKEEKSNRIILNESIGNLNFKSTFVGIRSFDNGELIGILSIPFFESQDELNRKAVDVLSSIMSVFMGVFIGFFILSYFATSMLTDPLKVLSYRLKKTSLSQYNEPLEWASEDEIGMVVNEYNRMLVKLEESKRALSQTEKESAWREMAKQVAHEIKNPLTPMKLKLQHMKRMLSFEESGKREQAEKSINSLLEQVDTLSDIASSFSEFAKMPVPKQEVFELSTLLRQVVSLHNSEKEPVDSDIETGDFIIVGDRQFMSRAITNLILNAFQAIPEGRLPQVKVSLKRSDERKVRIAVHDNGTGIEESIRERVFLPNFSTKFTGSGIGLALVKRGIEHANGRIWFETEEGKGTTFFIELPLKEGKQ